MRAQSGARNHERLAVPLGLQLHSGRGGRVRLRTVWCVTEYSDVRSKRFGAADVSGADSPKPRDKNPV